MGEWHLEADVPSAEDAVDVRVLQDVGGCYGVMMELPFGAHPVAVIGGGHRALRESSSGELTDPLWRPGPDVSCCRPRSSRGTHSLLDSAVRECGESRVAPVQRASFRPRMG
jgi:hypothetical protein